MKRKRADPFAAAARLATPGDWLGFAEKLYAREKLALGQVATNPHDEALYLLLHALHLPLDSEPTVLTKKLTAGERRAVEKILRRRVLDRVPAAYLTQEAWLGPHRFYVDERVIIPRSYFLEIIPEQLDAWLPAGRKVQRVADVCTGSGCLAILLAHQFPSARVEACDLSAEALEVAKINVRAHHLTRRVKLHASDVFDSVPAARYDVILSNPPYEPSALVDAQAPGQPGHSPQDRAELAACVDRHRDRPVPPAADLRCLRAPAARSRAIAGTSREAGPCRIMR